MIDTERFRGFVKYRQDALEKSSQIFSGATKEEPSEQVAHDIAVLHAANSTLIVDALNDLVMIGLELIDERQRKELH
jgi:hypothetical protein